MILGIASIHVVLMTMLVVGLMDRQQTFFLKLNRDRALSIAVNLANASNLYVVSDELEGLQSLVTNYDRVPSLKYAFVTSYDGVVLAHTNEKNVGLKVVDSVSTKLIQEKSTLTLIENHDLIDIATPIINRNDIIGWARIGLSQDYVEPNLDEIRKNGAIYILISLIVGSIFAVLVAGRLSKGLQKLVIASKKIKEGDRDLRVGASSSFEVSQLGTAFNQMLDDISANEKLLSKVLENMPVGIMILDAAGKITSVNPATKEIWQGVKYVGANEYGLYRAWFTSTGVELQPSEWGAAIALAEDKPVLNQELEIECFDKSRKIILNSAIPLHDTDKKVSGVIVINVDVTGRKNSEIELRSINHDIGERVKELRCLYQMSRLSIAPNKTTEDILRECVNLIPSSYQFPEITCARIVYEEQHFETEDFTESVWKQEADIISKGVSIGKVEVYYKEQKPDQQEGPFVKEERLLIDSIADILASAGDRRKAESELEKSEEKHRALVENISDSIVLIDENQHAFYRCPSTMRTLGFEEKELEKHHLWYCVHPDDTSICHNLLAEAHAHPGQQFHEQFRLRNKSGDYIWVEGSMVNLLSNPSVKAFILNYRDITERKKFEEQQLLITSIVNSTGDGILSRRFDCMICSWNMGA